MPSRLYHRFSVVGLIICWLLLYFGTTARATTTQGPLVLISDSKSTRAIALDSVTFRKEPFNVSSPFAADGRARIIVFALNASIGDGEDLSAFTADAETADHKHHLLVVEQIVPVESLPWLSSIVLRLNEDLADAGDVLVSVTHSGLASNRVRIGIGNIGGGLADDPGSGPTPAPPYLISGHITLDGQALSGVTVTLNGDQTAVTTTDATGSYSLAVSGFGDYTVTASKSFFHFTPGDKTFIGLSNNQVETNFVAIRNLHTVSGTILNDQNQTLNGISVTLSDENNSPLRVTTTSNGGKFVFTSIPAGFNYKVTPTPTVLLDFNSQNVEMLNGDLVLNFSASRRLYSLAGSVVDNNNQPVTGVNLWLSGSQTAVTRSDSNGHYSFMTNALGSYTVTAQIEQDYFSFNPAAQSVVNNTSNRTLNFSATFRPLPNPQKVLEFDGTPKTVDYSNFWPEFTNLGHFFWEFWAMPGPNAAATYMVSDGYGGLHAVLFGVASFNRSEDGRYQLLGNMNDGLPGADHIFYFGSDQGPAVGEWGHFAAGWNGKNIITYFNGVPVGKTPYDRPRQSTGPGNGAGRLLIGGSDHSNFDGRIAQVRGYEGSNPRENGGVESSFIPETIFSREGNLLSYYFTPSTVVADLSRGFSTGSHPGVPRGTILGVLADCGSCPPPQFVVDPTAPNFATNTAPQPVNVPTPPGAPAGALVFDSFSRQNSTYMFGNRGGLGSTEGGTAGPQLWQTAETEEQLKPFGILNGRGVLLGNNTALNWLNTGSTTGNLDIRVDRTPGSWGSGTNTGLSFRVVDSANYFFAYTSDSIASPGNQFLTVGFYLAGTKTTLTTGVPIPAEWRTLQVITKETGSIEIFIDLTLVFSTSNETLAKASRAGLFNNGPGLALVNRWDNFRVFAAN